MGRATQGVHVVNLKQLGDRVADVVTVPREDEIIKEAEKLDDAGKK